MTLSALGIFSAAGAGGPLGRIAVAGYFAGGLTGGSYLTTVDKFAFPSDSRSTLGTGLASGRMTAAGFANSGIAGYVAGGNASGNFDSVEKFAFPADSRSTLATGLSTARREMAGFANSAVAG
jgi:hypothetical protein